MEIPNFQTQKELFDFLVANKSTIIAAKKAITKHADSVVGMPVFDESLFTTKEESTSKDPNRLQIKVVINTTNFLDSHGDVHMPGLWTKSLQENSNILFLQEHALSFKTILAKKADLKAYTKGYLWTDLGYNVGGKTEALVFEALLKREKNPEMFNLYESKEVDNHSVGMRYTKVLLAINNKDYANEFEIWEKYIDQVVNKQAAEDKGFMWVVKEAQVIEGSAVPLGSNRITPTLSTSQKNDEPGESTHNTIEPSTVTLEQAKELINQSFKTILS